MLYDSNVEFALVDVQDVAEAIFKAATTLGLHSKNYLLSSESYPVSDITLMLNHQPPKNNASVIYKNGLAQKELEIKFRPVQETLNNYSK
jgi:hypothetical protein